MMRTLSMAPAVLGKVYMDTVLKAMMEPKAFFESEAGRGPVRPVAVLLASALIYTGASLLLYSPPRPGAAAVILFTNAVGTPLIAAAIGYGLMRATLGKRVSFRQFSGVYAYASAVVLPAMWMPYGLLVAEPWRWWLIGKGLKNGCGLSLGATLGIIGATIVTMVALFQILTQAAA